MGWMIDVETRSGQLPIERHGIAGALLNLFANYHECRVRHGGCTASRFQRRSMVDTSTA